VGGKERTGCDAEHSPHSSAEVKMCRSYISSFPWRLHGDSGTAFSMLYIKSEVKFPLKF
jgi:hypothetical protein